MAEALAERTGLRQLQKRDERCVCSMASGRYQLSIHFPLGATMENQCRNPTKFFSNDFFAVALFSGIGLVVSLIAVICSEQGSWL